MFKYCKKIFTNIQISTYNFFHNPDKQTVYPKTYVFQSDEVELTPVDIKLVRLNTLLYIKQCKNTFFKYTNPEKFNSDLYNSFIDDDNFDGGDTAFDDEEDIRIFDKYILDYIKSRNDIITYLQCKNFKINIVTKLEELQDFSESIHEKDILFIIDMSDKDIFNYCINSRKNIKDNNVIKNVILSIIFKVNGELINIKLNDSKHMKNHPYVVLESSLK